MNKVKIYRTAIFERNFKKVLQYTSSGYKYKNNIYDLFFLIRDIYKDKRKIDLINKEIIQGFKKELKKKKYKKMIFTPYSRGKSGTRKGQIRYVTTILV